MKEERSENLQNLEDHADTDVVASDDDPGEKMRPAGEGLEEADGDAPMKRIDEAVEGGEETEDMGDVEAGDLEAPSS